MAKRTFPEGFKEMAVAYPKAHPEKSMKECAADLDIGYSTLRRWINELEADAAPAAEPPEAEKVLASEPEETADAAAVEEAVADAAPVLEDLLQETAPVEAVEMPHTLAVNEDEPAYSETDAEETAGESEAAKAEPETAPVEMDDAAEAGENAAAIDETNETAVASEADVAPKTEEKDALDDDPLFASIGSVMSGGATPHDDDYAFRCKSHPSSLKDINHMAGDLIVSVSAQVGNVVEGVGHAAERLSLYKKRHDLKKERKILKKEKEKRMKR